jgi:hypothetical protein
LRTCLHLNGEPGDDITYTKIRSDIGPVHFAASALRFKNIYIFQNLNLNLNQINQTWTTLAYNCIKFTTRWM